MTGDLEHKFIPILSFFVISFYKCRFIVSIETEKLFRCMKCGTIVNWNGEFLDIMLK